ncbi:hypothetical protein [Chryseobacterium koreense]|uniref:Uncharacterized protein n=1 Tax=Chryseobacterium koreense CCUG 49689 TaxID=1304281 RepID=A0A0J7LU62_9FLAO|nr:hypothetical protein [Chryseobacterium koreense]KMQ72490.1 hypothetical protein ACM44_01770 [Chryseobacterium koreense CCUG 49689]MBB5333409.1 hypothetical protein [Chryseobacterium koreense]
MNLSPEGQKLFNLLITEMLDDGFERISENTFYKKLGSITVSLGDQALNIMHQGKLYGIIPEREFLKLSNSLEPLLLQIKYLLAFSMRQDMNRVVNFFTHFFLN